MKLTRVQNYWNRQALVKYSFILIIVVFVYQAINIHSKQISGTSLQNKASTKAEQTLTENAVRGNILDRNGNILAIDLIQNKINLDPMIIQDEYIPLLAEALLMPIEEFREFFSIDQLYFFYLLFEVCTNLYDANSHPPRQLQKYT